MHYNGIGEGGLNDLLTRRLSVTGGPPSPAVEPGIFPTLVLESERPEWGFLKNELTYNAQWDAPAGGAGTRSSCWFINAGSARTTLVVLKDIEALAGSTLVLGKLFQWGDAVLPFGTTSFGICTDTRVPRGGALRVISDNTLALPALTSFWRSLATSFRLTYPIVLAPGWGFYISPASDNVAFSGNVVWSERQAEPRELV